MFDALRTRVLPAIAAWPLQEQVLDRLLAHLLPGGFLVIGKKEHLPQVMSGLTPLDDAPQVFLWRS